MPATLCHLNLRALRRVSSVRILFVFDVRSGLQCMTCAGRLSFHDGQFSLKYCRFGIVIIVSQGLFVQGIRPKRPGTPFLGRHLGERRRRLDPGPGQKLQYPLKYS